MRTSALINNDLLIDCGPDLIPGAQKFGVYLGDLTTLLVTHAHSDHWQPSNLMYRHPAFCPTPLAPLEIYGPETLMRSVPTSERWMAMQEEATLHVTTVAAGDRWRHEGYTITALPANHAGDDPALLYVIDDGTHKLLYATDSGPFTEEAWSILAETAPVDAVLMDETMGSGKYGEHQSFESFLTMRRRFIEDGVLADGAQVVALHFSHQSNPPHDDLVAYFEPHDVIVAYDGMVIHV
jgi:phosphoribosyl 1,2-cyclic phosphate phosphodiesterase